MSLAPTSLQCPVCRSTDLRRTDPATWRCNTCDSLLAEADGALTVRVRGDVPSGGAAWRLVVPGALLVGLGGLMLWALWPQASPPVPARPEPVVARPPPTPDPNRQPDHELVGVKRGETPDGGMFWLGSFRNLDRLPMERPTMVVQLFDRSGAVLATARGATVQAEVGPGEEAPLLVTLPEAVDAAGQQVRLEDVVWAEPNSTAVPLGTRDLRTTRDADGVHVHGTLVNLRDAPVEVERVVVVGRSRSGAPVAWAEAEPAARQLGSRATTTFQAAPSPYVLEAPATWTALGVGRVAR